MLPGVTNDRGKIPIKAGCGGLSEQALEKPLLVAKAQRVWIAPHAGRIVGRGDAPTLACLRVTEASPIQIGLARYTESDA